MKYGFSTLRVPKEATERDTVENTMKWNLKKKSVWSTHKNTEKMIPCFLTLENSPKAHQ